jgi:hypothetical protein
MSTQAPAVVTREVARTELRKFLALAALAETPLEMFSILIDDEWHKLVADPDAYAAFCETTVGHHVAHVEGTDSGEVSWIADYHRQWGELPTIWFTDETGVVDQTAYDLYRRTRTVTASWNCSATTNDPDYAEAA